MLDLTLVSTLLAALAPDAGAAFGPGEQSTYQVSWAGLPAGEAQITVGAATRVDDALVWPIVCTGTTRAIASAFPFKDKFVTWWDDAKGRTVGNDFWGDEFKTRRKERIRFPEGSTVALVTRQLEAQPVRESEWNVAAGSLDVAAAAMALRKVPLSEGAVVRFPVFTGTSNQVLQGTVLGRQTLTTALGKTEVWKVAVRTEFGGQLAARRDVLLYLSADHRQVPVKVEAEFVLGTITADLVRYEPGAGS